MNFKPPMYNVEVIFKKVIRIKNEGISLINHTYIIEIVVQKGSDNEIYSTKNEKVFLRLLASNRELSGHTIIEYAKEKYAPENFPKIPEVNTARTNTSSSRPVGILFYQ